VSTVTEVTLHPLRARTEAAVGGWAHRTEHRQGLLLRLHGSSGQVGLGEASPLPNYSPDQLEVVTRCLSNLGLVGAELPTDPDSVLAAISALSSRIPPSLPSARFALETALVDLVARDTGVPALRVVTRDLDLSELEAAPRSLHLSYLLPRGSDELIAQRAAAARKLGFETFKLKVDPHMPLDQLLALLRGLRSLLGRRARLRLDVNQGWSLLQATDWLPMLEPLELEFVEEPVRTADRDAIGPSAVPVAWDESLVGAASLPESSTVAAVILKPALHGFLGTLSLATQARRQGLSVIVTHTFDGPVAHAAATVIAFAVASPDRAQGLGKQPGWGLLPGAVVVGIEGPRLTRADRIGLPLDEVEPC
jgi:o-succinylbenzoate synthase